jgi:RNA polymerase sigma-70 factor (ECF subfamily)
VGVGGAYLDQRLGLEEGYAAPEARYEQRESVELAFIAALQHLPAAPRAVLVLVTCSASRLGGRRVARDHGPLGQRALRRARKAVAERLPGQSQQATLRSLGDADLQAVVERCIDAWERGDVDAILAMLAEDATFTMPPLRTWYRGRDAIAVFLTGSAIRVRWRFVPARANGQRAFGTYARDAEQNSYTARIE